MNKQFQNMERDRISLGENNDCAVKAVAFACYQEYDFVLKLFTKQGRQPKQGTPFYITRAVLKTLGRDVKDVTKDYKARTVTSLKKEITKRDNLLVRVRGHILCANEGEIQDWTKDRRHRIRQILRVVQCQPKVTIR